MFTLLNLEEIVELVAGSKIWDFVLSVCPEVTLDKEAPEEVKTEKDPSPLIPNAFEVRKALPYSVSPLVQSLEMTTTTQAARVHW